MKRKPGLARLAGRWSPTPIAQALARHLAVRENALAVDIHLLTFGGLTDAGEWLSSLRTANVGKSRLR